jgi:hypothetical protein
VALPGMRLPWIDGYEKAYQVTMIVDSQHHL